MITFAFLGNTLFLTILVAMLSNTYNNLSRNATAEIEFRRAVLTFEGVKSDAIFAYRPPFNVLALATLLPLKFILTPRWFHKVNITAVRILNAPILLLISWYERRYLWRRSTFMTPPRKHTWLSMWERFGAHGDLQAVFDTDPPQEIVDEMDDVDDVLSAAGEFENDARQAFLNTLRVRRGSRSISEASGVWGGGGGAYSVHGAYGGVSRSRSRMNGFRRRKREREDLEGPDLDGNEPGEDNV